MYLSIPENYKNVLLKISSHLKYGRGNYLPILVLTFILHSGRLNLRILGQKIVTEQRHKSNVCRVFNHSQFNTKASYLQLYNLFFHQLELPFSGKWVIVFDTTAKKTKRRWGRRKPGNKRGGKRRLGRLGNNCIQYKQKGKSGKGSRANLWVMGLLITETGIRIPLPRRSYYTKGYAQKHGLKYRSQIDIVVEMLSRLRVPGGVKVTVLADSFFESKKLDELCTSRGFTYITVIDSNRCLADDQGRKINQHVVALWDTLLPKDLQKITLNNSTRQFSAFQRSSGHQKERTYYACKKTLHIAKLGKRAVVFSKKQKRTGKGKGFSFKTLVTNDDQLTARQIVELYELRWEIELYFKELKSYLHFADYDFEDFKAAERWIDVVMMAFLFLEYIRLQHLKMKNEANEKELVTARTPQMIEVVKKNMDQENISYIEQAIKTQLGRQNLLKNLSKLKLVA